jgi:hypothetical protein
MNSASAVPIINQEQVDIAKTVLVKFIDTLIPT